MQAALAALEAAARSDSREQNLLALAVEAARLRCGCGCGCKCQPGSALAAVLSLVWALQRVFGEGGAQPEACANASPLLLHAGCASAAGPRWATSHRR